MAKATSEGGLSEPRSLAKKCRGFIRRVRTSRGLGTIRTFGSQRDAVFLKSDLSDRELTFGKTLVGRHVEFTPGVDPAGRLTAQDVRLMNFLIRKWK